MKALFDIRGKQIVVETDSSVPADTVRVRSLDAFSNWIATLDSEPRRAVVHRRRSPQPVASAEAVDLPQPPEGGWRDAAGRKIYLNANGITRERVALALSRYATRLDSETLALVCQRYGVGGASRPHSSYELCELHKIATPSLLTTRIHKALRRCGMRIQSKS